jgi:signal transduction histidine kinase
MRLWIKISLVAVITVAVATSTCSLMMLVRSGESNLDLAIQNVLTDQRLCDVVWKDAMDHNSVGVSVVTQRTLARYYINQYADDNTMLISGNDVIFNPTGIDLKAYLPLTGATAQQYIIQDIAGSTVLIVGSNITINATTYSLYVTRDISSVFLGIETLSYQFAFINLAVLIAAALVIVLLVRLVLRPVKTLKSSAELIADGIYDRRIEIAERDEIGELAGDFNRMAAAVETSVQELKDEAERRALFIAALTHELKTPMTSISGNAQMLLRTKLTDEERDEALVQVDDACMRVERLSQKMMQLIALQQGEDIELREQSVYELLEIVRVSCAENLKQRELTLRIKNSMTTLSMDSDLLSSLFVNLVDNAAKASESGGVIDICAKDNTIAVIDRGKGISSEEIVHITQPFYMADKSRGRKSGSIGLGLALAEEIALLHGARLEFESEVGIGTTVRVVFVDV